MTNEQLATLATELEDASYAANLAAGNDQAVADSLNAAKSGRRALVPLWKVKKHAIENGYWPLVKAAAYSHASATVQGAAISALDYIDDQRFTNLDFDLASTTGMLTALVAGGVMTADQKTSVEALATVADLTRAEEIGLPYVTAYDVGTVRNG